MNAQLRMREDENHKLQMEVAKLWIYQKIHINCRSDLEYLFWNDFKTLNSIICYDPALFHFLIAILLLSLFFFTGKRNFYQH